MNDNFISDLQRYVANVSIGASTVRGSPKGTAAAARKYLANIKLSHVPGKAENQFKEWLNKQTIALRSKLPQDGRHWGLARKCLNIFLRGVVYNRFLCEDYDLYRIESWLEVPLDKHVATRLRNETEGNALPRWKTIKGLKSSTSKSYQQVAAKIAARKGFNRVHLDALYWRRDSNG